MDDLSKILETAEGMFRKYGIRSVTMSDLARQLGMSKKTLYVHVENKHDLIHKIMALYIENEHKMCTNIMNTAKDALDEMLQITLQVQQNIKDINPSLLFDLRKYHYPIWEQFEHFRKGFLCDMMRNNMERGKKEGIYREELNADVVSRIYISTVELFADDELFPADHFPRVSLHKEMVMYHLHGIISDDGKRLLKTYLNNIQEKIKS